MMEARWLMAAGIPEAKISTWLAPIGTASEAHGITTPRRIASFLAQIAHESGGCRYVSELWGPTDAQKRYEGRTDLGNVHPGDGFRFRGRGLIQVTGRTNYRLVGKAMGLDLEANPDLLLQPANAAESAALFWETKGLNILADKEMFQAITQRINGGLNGYADRLNRWNNVKEAMGI